MKHRQSARRVALFGGNANNESNAGSFYVNTNNGSTNRNANTRSQLSLFIYDETDCLASWQNTCNPPKC